MATKYPIEEIEIMEMEPVNEKKPLKKKIGDTIEKWLPGIDALGKSLARKDSEPLTSWLGQRADELSPKTPEEVAEFGMNFMPMGTISKGGKAIKKATENEVPKILERFKDKILKEDFTNIKGIDPKKIKNIRVFGSSVEGKAKPRDIDVFVKVSDDAAKFKKQGGLPVPIRFDRGKFSYTIMPEESADDLLNAMLYTGRKDADRLYSGKAVNIPKRLWKPSGQVNQATKNISSPSNLKEFTITTKEPIKTYRGEGKGIGNTTFVKGRYLADSEDFAKTFGEVKEETIPKGTKVFDFDKIKSNPDQNIIPHQLLVDKDRLTKYLIDQGFDATKNTNTRGVEYVLLNKTENELLDMAMKSKNHQEFTKKVLDDWDKYRDELRRVGSQLNQRQRHDYRGSWGVIWDKAQRMKDTNIKGQYIPDNELTRKTNETALRGSKERKRPFPDSIDSRAGEKAREILGDNLKFNEIGDGAFRIRKQLELTDPEFLKELQKRADISGGTPKRHSPENSKLQVFLEEAIEGEYFPDI